MSFPNFLSSLRFLFSLAFVFIYLWKDFYSEKAWLLSMLCILFFAELSDCLDGFFARRWKSVSTLGCFLDPLADLCFHMAAFVSFLSPPFSLHPLPIIFMLYREFFIAALRSFCASQGDVLAARLSGKIKALLQGLALFVILIAYPLLSYASFYRVSNALLSCLALYSCFSAWDYFRSRKKLFVKA